MGDIQDLHELAQKIDQNYKDLNHISTTLKTTADVVAKYVQGAARRALQRKILKGDTICHATQSECKL